MDRVTEKVSTSERLNEIISERNLRQTDILKLAAPFCVKYGTKLSRSDLSQYIHGKTTPHQAKLSVLAMALGVNEAWLMGYNTEKCRQDSSESSKMTYTDFNESINAESDSIKDLRKSVYAYNDAYPVRKYAAEPDSSQSYRAAALFEKLNASDKQYVIDIMNKLLDSENK